MTESDILLDPAKDLEELFEIEEMVPDYFDQDALVAQPKQVFRINVSGKRFYYTFKDEYSQPEFFVSVTTFINQTLPKSKFLEDWAINNFNSAEEKDAYVQDKAKYGTFMHSQIVDFLINKTYDLDRLKSRLKTYIESEQLPSDFIHYADELKKDMLAFARFCIDTRLKPLAIEIVLTHFSDKYGGALDLVAELDAPIKGFHGEVYKSGKKKGQPRMTKEIRRVKAIIDFKSGRKGFFESHVVQLGAYREMWNENYPEIPIDYIFNWSPVDWRGEPKYKFEDQTQSKSLRKLPFLVDLAKIENEDRSDSVVVCSGVLDLVDPNLGENVQEFTLSEIISNKRKKDETPVETEQQPIEEIAGEKATEIANSQKQGKSGVSGKENEKVTKKDVKKPRVNPKDLGI